MVLTVLVCFKPLFRYIFCHLTSYCNIQQIKIASAFEDCIGDLYAPLSSQKNYPGLYIIRFLTGVKIRLYITFMFSFKELMTETSNTFIN